MPALSILRPAEAALLHEARRGVLATLAADGHARLVPIAYAFDIEQEVIYSALDEKPKSFDDPRRLARVRDILARPSVTVLVDRWSEDWAQLAWVRLEGEAALIESEVEPEEHARAVSLLRERYPQYARQKLEDRPVVRVRVERSSSWGLER
jgi:PPOX class probable F420-dependent enzyme